MTTATAGRRTLVMCAHPDDADVHAGPLDPSGPRGALCRVHQRRQRREIIQAIALFTDNDQTREHAEAAYGAAHAVCAPG